MALKPVVIRIMLTGMAIFQMAGWRSSAAYMQKVMILVAEREQLFSFFQRFFSVPVEVGPIEPQRKKNATENEKRRTEPKTKKRTTYLSFQKEKNGPFPGWEQIQKRKKKTEPKTKKRTSEPKRMNEWLYEWMYE